MSLVFLQKETFKCLWFYGFKSLISDKISNQHLIIMNLFIEFIYLSFFEYEIHLTYYKSCWLRETFTFHFILVFHAGSKLVPGGNFVLPDTCNHSQKLDQRPKKEFLLISIVSLIAYLFHVDFNLAIARLWSDFYDISSSF